MRYYGTDAPEVSAGAGPGRVPACGGRSDGVCARVSPYEPRPRTRRGRFDVPLPRSPRLRVSRTNARIGSPLAEPRRAAQIVPASQGAPALIITNRNRSPKNQPSGAQRSRATPAPAGRVSVAGSQ